MMGTYVKLKDIAKVLNGYAFESAKYVDNGIRVIRITNVQKGYVEDLEPKFYPSDELENIKEFILHENDLLISLTGNVGRVALLTKEMLPAALNQRVACIRLKKESEVTKKYLYHLMNTDSFERKCVNSAKGLAQKNMSTEWLKDFEIYLPSIEKQAEINQILDKTLDLISKDKKQILALDLLVKSRFIEMFGDMENNDNQFPIMKLKDLCDVGSSKRLYQRELCLDGIPFLRIADFDRLLNYGVVSSEIFVSVDKFEELSSLNLVPQDGDILVTSRGTIGKCYIVKDKDRFYFQDGMISWLSHIDSKVKSKYLSFLFDMPLIRKQILKMQAGSTVAYLSIKMLKDINIVVPPIELQNGFIDFVAQVDKSKLAVQQSLNELETLKKSLMQQYFG